MMFNNPYNIFLPQKTYQKGSINLMMITSEMSISKGNMQTFGDQLP